MSAFDDDDDGETSTARCAGTWAMAVGRGRFGIDAAPASPAAIRGGVESVADVGTFDFAMVGGWFILKRLYGDIMNKRRCGSLKKKRCFVLFYGLVV